MAAFDQSWPKAFSVDLQPIGRLLSVQQTPFVCVLHLEKETLYVQFPSFGGVRVRNGNEGFFTPDALKGITYTEKDGTVTALAGNTSVKITANGMLAVCNAADTTVLSIRLEDILQGTDGVDARTVVRLPLEKQESVFGFGERFNTFNQNGHRLPLWNVDTIYHVVSAEGDKVEGYKNIPFFHSSKGYAFFYNSAANAVADLTDGFTLTVDTDILDWYIFTGTPLQNIRQYTDLTGKPILPPRWAFRYWAGAGASIWQKKGSRNEDVLSCLQDCFDGYNRLGTGLPTLYAEYPVPFIEDSFKLAEKNSTKMLMWVRPNLAKARMKQILGESDERKLPVTDTIDWLRVKDCIDFTHPRAVDVVKGIYKDQWSWGLKGSMIDFGEYWPWNGTAYNGVNGNEMHNFQTYYYNKTMYEAWHDQMGDDYITFSRSACAGSQKWSANFGGDQASTWFGLQQNIAGILSLSSCGFSIWGSDIGGFFGTPTTDTYCRWVAFSAFSPLMRAHGIITAKDPWNFGKVAEETFKKYFHLRESMLDLLYSAAVHAHKTGEPMVKAMAVAYPADTRFYSTDDQYMFCDSLLVAPVYMEDTVYRAVTLPDGGFTDFWTGEHIDGGKTITYDTPLDTIPVFVKDDALLPLTKDNVPVYVVTKPTKCTAHTVYFEENEAHITVSFDGQTLCVDGDVDRGVMPFGFTPEAVLVNGKEGGALVG